MIRALGRFLGRLALRGFLWLLAAPAVFTVQLVRFWAARSLLGDIIPCRTCGTEIPVLGLRECGACAYTFYGFYFARCEVCGSVPPYLECDHCGASTMNPMLFG